MMGFVEKFWLDGRYKGTRMRQGSRFGVRRNGKKCGGGDEVVVS
jgi:hypothetical protein